MAIMLQVKEVDLQNAGFSAPQTASCYYPDPNANTHIHLGVPTQNGAQIAVSGNRFVEFIGVKINGVNRGNLARCQASGYFDLRTAPLGTPQVFLNILDNLDLLVNGCV
jgi:hypothetical protein